MTTITLPPEIERPLLDEALRRGTTPERLAIDCLRREFTASVAAEVGGSRTLLDDLAPFVGVVEGTGENLSQRTRERFLETLKNQPSSSTP